MEDLICFRAFFSGGVAVRSKKNSCTSEISCDIVVNKKVPSCLTSHFFQLIHIFIFIELTFYALFSYFDNRPVSIYDRIKMAIYRNI